MFPMATIDRRGAILSANDPPISTNPNPDLAIKAPVRVATTGGNIVLSGLQTIDGVALAAGDRVLVKDQADATTNGLYNAATGPWTRAIDANNNSQWAQGLQVLVAQGIVNADQSFICTAVNPIVLGTSTLTFVGSSVAGVSPGSITNAKLAAMAAGTVKGNATGAPATPQDCNWPAISGGAKGQVLTKNSATAGDASWLNAWLNIEAFGGKGDNATDNATPLTNALAALTGTGGCVYFPPGKYRFNSAVSFNLPAGIFSVALVGAAQDATVLFWPNGSGGLTFNYSGAGSSAHIRDMSFTTGQNGGGTALTFSMGAASGEAASDLYRVTFRGDDGYGVANFWNTGLSIVNVSNVAVDQGTFFAPLTHGTGISIAGLPASTLYAVQINIDKSDFQGLNIGILYGSYVQGITISQSNFTGVGTGISSAASELGVLAQLAITDSQFNTSVNSIALNTAVIEVQISNCLFIQAAGTGAILLGSSTHFTISGNEITSSSVTGTNGIVIGGGFGTITGNDVFGFGTGLWLQAGSSNVVVSGNTLFGNTSNIINAGANNFIVNNPGYNPVGAGGITVGASPFVYTAGSSPETIYIFAGTVSAVTFDKNGGALGVVASNQSPCTVHLGPFEQVKVTYSVIPNMNKMVH